MNSKTKTYRESDFSFRLQQQLLKKGKKNSPTSLAREFNLRWRGVPVTPNAVRKWLLGESLPTMDKMEVLANLFGVSTDWLRWGEMENTASPSAKRSELTYQFKNPLPFENMEAAVLQDFLLLNTKNKELILSIIETLLVQQKIYS